MEVVRDRPALRAARAGLAGPLGFVPTMGALHRGHLALVAAARRETRSVVASLFVNPRQFGPAEDFARYPRDEAADRATFAAAGVDLLFVPPAEVIYPPGSSTGVDVGPLGERLEGAARPGHFRGVATVVTILLDLVGPDRAYFGQKDGQQTIVVRRLVSDLGLPVEVVVVPTVREPDGLALSSRNGYLGPAERAAAPVLHAALGAVAETYRRGERDGERLRDLMRRTVAAEPLALLEYASVADTLALEELATVDRPALASLAARFGSTRLIDCQPLP